MGRGRSGLDPSADQLIRIWADPNADQTHSNGSRLKWIGPEHGSRVADSHFNFEPNFEGIIVRIRRQVIH